MLYEIESPATAHNSVILLHPEDSVAIARKNLETDCGVDVNGITLRTRAPVPAGDAVYRYGNVIGFATAAIEPGEHVHVHNLGYQELDTAEVTIQEKPAASRAV